jgi:hypothetical protein
LDLGDANRGVAAAAVEHVDSPTAGRVQNKPRPEGLIRSL